MDRKLINLAGLTGIIALISYTMAVIIAPSAFPGYDWMAQAVSDLSAETAPSRLLWNQLSAAYNVCSPVCVMCISIFVSDKKTGTKLFRLGVYLFTIMNWISAIGYRMFPLSDSGKEIGTFQEKMHIVITIVVVLLSIASLIILIVSGFKKNGMKNIAIWAAVALGMMFVGAIGKNVVSPDYFGIVERFSVFAAVGFNAVLGLYLFNGFE
ncbi:MAG: DUF998 domain-containing protein [Lachnospiraceae bacterium]|nr:DUF998 domain-containing protein [Lachnospiraceae bacterium]